MALVDALVRGKYGGTGKTVDWAALEEYRSLPDAPPLVLAGGLTADNVAKAVARVRPAAVDTASGVERSPGHKEPAAVEAFVRAARRALGSLQP